jgi:hypothetical protein
MNHDLNPRGVNVLEGVGFRITLKEAKIILDKVKGNDPISKTLKSEAEYVLKTNKNANEILDKLKNEFSRLGFKVNGPMKGFENSLIYSFTSKTGSYTVQFDPDSGWFHVDKGKVDKKSWVEYYSVEKNPTISQKELDFLKNVFKSAAGNNAVRDESDGRTLAFNNRI